MDIEMVARPSLRKPSLADRDWNFKANVPCILPSDILRIREPDDAWVKQG